jgi:hypothetical protein
MDGMGWFLMELGAWDKGGYDSCLGHRLAEVTKNKHIVSHEVSQIFLGLCPPKRNINLCPGYHKRDVYDDVPMILQS